MRKRRVAAHPDSVLLVLRALGASVNKVDDVPRALKEKREELLQRGIEPVVVAWDGRLPRLNLKKATLVLEDSTTAPWPLRKALPPGYHRLNGSLVISAPTKANFPLSEKSWGVFAPLYALHSKRSFGAGDLTDLQTLLNWTSSRGGRVVSTLPLLSGFLEDKPFEPSPYSPASRLFWNEFYIDPTRVPEFLFSVEAQKVMSRRPARAKFVDYRETMRTKRSILELLSRNFFDLPSESRLIDFQRFIVENPEASEYARFRAQLETPQRDRAEQYYLYAQWVVQSQLKEISEQSQQAGSLLYLDLPLGLHPNSFDAWRYPELFVSGVCGGAPPDPVFTTGQNWSFRPMHPRTMRENGYRYAIAYIRNHLRFAKLLRIDHVMGLHRLFWIPDGHDGDRGLYVEYPAEEMYAILSLESHRFGAGIIGENLGVVPPEVNRSMTRHNIWQLYVAQYETAVDAEREALRRPPANSAASLNTHDMFPFQAFIEGTDITERQRLKFITAKEAAAERRERQRVCKALSKLVGPNLFEGSMDFLARSNAGIVLLNLEDLWRETKPQNIPSTTKEHPNWKRRMRYSIEHLEQITPPEGVLRRGTTNVTPQRSRSVSVQRRKSPSSL